MSTTLKNIKIPYPTEGVIRSAQLNDTVCPENSVQIAVNMNFDRVGALQTRPGVETFATSLTGEIQNFGTLNNSVDTDGYTRLAKAAITNSLGSIISDLSITQIDSTHYLLFWGAAATGVAQVAEIDLTTETITLKGSPLAFYAAQSFSNSSGKLDSTHFINFWQGSGNDGYVQAFSVNTSTWAVTALSSPLKFENDINQYNSCSFVDSLHFINFWGGGASGITNKAQVFAVNAGTFAVTAVGSALTVDAASYAGGPYNNCINIDNQHYINFWASDTGVGNTQVFNVNLATFEVTALSSAFVFDATLARLFSAKKIDATHFICFWSTTSNAGKARTFVMDAGTFAITAAGALLSFATYAIYNSCVATGDGIHFVNFFTGASNIGLAQTYAVNLSTFNITASSNLLNTGTYVRSNVAISISSYRVMNLWNNTGTSPGPAEGNIFSLFGSPQYNDLLYAQQGNADVYSWDGANWTSRRSGLYNNQKARFTQYLNYIWMVNGNAMIGDPVMTSNGGAFGTTLVPTGLPPGDSISAGFDGRVWIMDKYADTLYYTDIVQFTPPAAYVLSFNVSVNYLKNFSTQDGELMTALWTVPRALLLFKENHIYRIYGATSVDAYPAYNVGTFSQESIVETKDGIYFHHSSGFYKFDYNSQPVEISRRIIDFVKAIPRANYEDVVGIWDGFDAVKWTIGPVTVEGVTYSNCQVRYTISTQVWTIYNYEGNTITSMIRYDNGTDIYQAMGTSVGVVGKLDSGVLDFNAPINYEMIDRWRSYTEMYSKSKSISGLMVSSENGGGTRFEYQTEKTPPNVWQYIDTVKDKYDALFPNANTDDFNNSRFRISGSSRGTPMIFHGIEILSIQDKGLDEN